MSQYLPRKSFCLDSSKGVVIIVLCAFVGICHADTSSNSTVDCIVKDIRDVPYPSMYSIGDKDVSTIGRLFLISEKSSDTCYINTTFVLSQYTLEPKEDFVIWFTFGCMSPVTILFDLEEHQVSMKNAIGYLQIQNCKMVADNIHKFASMVDMKVVNLVDSEFINKSTSDIMPSNESGSVIDNAVSFLVMNPNLRNETIVKDILIENRTFPSVKEVTFAFLGWKSIPSSVRSCLPYLESLEVQNNLFKTPPDFPWTSSYHNLPRNLSRSLWFQNYYSDFFRVEIEPHIYRRNFNLANNRIRNLTNYVFQGSLHMIMLENNGLESIGADTFTKVRDLQHLRLNNNNLTELPSTVFNTLSQLRYLDLSYNSMVQIPRDVFSKLKQLRFLSLAHNGLLSLPSGAFSNLEKLTDLDLKGNALQEVKFDALPVYSVNLKSVNLNLNPLTEIPEPLFYITNFKVAELQQTQIKINFSSLLDKIKIGLLVDSVVDPDSDETSDIYKPPLYRKKLDLTGSDVTSLDIPASKKSNKETIAKLTLILIYFEIILDGNPLVCDCRINSLREYTESAIKNGTLKGNEYFHKSWICASPEELSGRPLFDVKQEETYCEKTFVKCPDLCRCFERSLTGVIIVNCKNVGLMSLPADMPDGKLELWLQQNNISSLEPRNYFNRVHSLNLESNGIHNLQKSDLHSLNNIETLNLCDNYIVSVPKYITGLPLKSLFLSNNPLSCDCTNIWMKAWIKVSKDIVVDWDKITCNTQGNTAKQLVSTPDGDFVCKTFPDLKPHVTRISVLTSIASFVLFFVVCLVCVYRLEVKVLLFYYFGIHPFDKRFNDLEERIDISVIYSLTMREWVKTNVIEYLENSYKSLVLCDYHEQAIAGFSIQENVKCMIQSSKRILVVLSQDFVDSDLLSFTWTEAQKKARDTRTNFAIIVSHGVPRNKIQNVELSKYVRHGCSLDAKEMLFNKKLLYHCPLSKRKVVTHAHNKITFGRKLPDIKEAIESVYIQHRVKVQDQQPTIFVFYSENSLKLVKDTFLHKLEANGYRLNIPDRDFIPGAAKEDNILEAIDKSSHTLVVVSDESLQDEWYLFTIRSANQKSLRDKTNHMIFIFANDVDMSKVQDEEIKQYIRYHVTLCTGDEKLWDKLFLSLTKSDYKLLENGNNANGSQLNLGNLQLSIDDVKLNIDADCNEPMNDLNSPPSEANQPMNDLNSPPSQLV